MHAHHAVEVGALLAWFGLDAAALSPLLALFIFGLTVGCVHCSGMCGPFVLARTLRRLAGAPPQAGALHWRLLTAALPAYHAGRASTYMLLGGLAGALGEALAQAIDPALARLLLLGLAIVLVLLQLPQALAGLLPQQLVRRLTAIADPVLRLAGRGDYPAGLIFGLLPCAMVYAALALAAATSSFAAGALAMAGFALGTWLPLIGVAALGAGFARRFLPGLRRWSPAILALNLVGLGSWWLHAA